MSARNASPPRAGSRRWRWPVALSILPGALSVCLGLGCSASAPSPSPTSPTAAASPSQCAPYNVTNRRGKHHPSVEVAWTHPLAASTSCTTAWLSLGRMAPRERRSWTVRRRRIPKKPLRCRVGAPTTATASSPSAAAITSRQWSCRRFRSLPPITRRTEPARRQHSHPGSLKFGSGGFVRRADGSTTCISKDGELPPKEGYPSLVGLTDIWLNYSKQTDGSYKTDQSTAGSGNTVNLVDSLATGIELAGSLSG